MISSFSGEFAFLSNFYPALVSLDGVVYPSVEHAYQAAKYPKDERDRFLYGSAGRARRLARNADLPEDWEDTKVSLMHSLVTRKFRDRELAEKLIATYPHELVEGNTWGDTFWGVCAGRGQNMLGKILMQVREDVSTLYP